MSLPSMAALEARFERETLQAELLAKSAKENFEREKWGWRLGIYQMRALDVCLRLRIGLH